jgi:DNA repair protein RAD5
MICSSKRHVLLLVLASQCGLVYPYHGQNRKQNAGTLAPNAIVVTTYETLASDATYHANKAGTDYCAPCEQVRWWRIICDESHSLRDTSTQKSTAVMNLVADHKWLVSGTFDVHEL